MISYGLAFLCLGLVLALLGASFGGVGIFIGIWAALGATLVALAYFSERPRLLGKRQDGSLHPLAVVLCLPVMALNTAYWYFKRVRGGESPSDEVAPGIFVGGLPTPSELPEGVRTIVDLTSEFPAHAEVRSHPGYRVFPMLDDGFLEPREIEAIVATLAAAPTPMLIHCAAGHGRSATLAAALGIARGDFGDPVSAEEAMQKARPKIRYKKAQRERLTRWYLNRMN